MKEAERFLKRGYIFMIIGSTIGWISWFVAIFVIEGHDILKFLIGFGYGLAYGNSLLDWILKLKKKVKYEL